MVWPRGLVGMEGSRAKDTGRRDCVVELEKGLAMISVEERMAILDLCSRYNYYVDTDAAEQWADTFTSEGVFDGPAGHGGHRRVPDRLRSRKQEPAHAAGLRRNAADLPALRRPPGPRGDRARLRRAGRLPFPQSGRRLGGGGRHPPPPLSRDARLLLLVRAHGLCAPQSLYRDRHAAARVPRHPALHGGGDRTALGRL